LLIFLLLLSIDFQWGIDTVYQEDYPSLLYAAETGRKITYTPSNIVELTQEFSKYILSAPLEVQEPMHYLSYAPLSEEITIPLLIIMVIYARVYIVLYVLCHIEHRLIITPACYIVLG